MQTVLLSVAGAVATLSMAVSGWFATSQANAQTQISALQAGQAAASQKSSDIDTRLTRIEDKLDAIIAKK